MSKLTSYVTGAALILIVGACQREAFHPETIDQEYLTLGKGGGIANQVDTYYLLADGYAYRRSNREETYQELGRLAQSERTRTFQRAAALSDSLADFREPGNIYYFLTIHRQDTTYSYTWGSNNYDHPKTIHNFYQDTQTLIQRLP
ncbi:MAG: hypothetical protein WA958_15235 [Tunicatimonas sp.]